ncbi:MAG: hypothetical protein B6D64_01860 [Bacteroidetes bacterium 4484_276]|nr:MAG: hypothetical protein B6D64_01860 [Bacteroidetes bacterium 4484_276]
MVDEAYLDFSKQQLLCNFAIENENVGKYTIEQLECFNIRCILSHTYFRRVLKIVKFEAQEI